MLSQGSGNLVAAVAEGERVGTEAREVVAREIAREVVREHLASCRRDPAEDYGLQESRKSGSWQAPHGRQAVRYALGRRALLGAGYPAKAVGAETQPRHGRSRRSRGQRLAQNPGPAGGLRGGIDGQ